jgi:choline dehydrogenase
MKRANLTVVTGAHATRVLLVKRRAVGIAYLKNGGLQEARAEVEVILSGGAVNSPQLLLLSGIGSADELRRAGVSPAHHLPGVGKNLQDHLMVSVASLCTKPVSLESAETLVNFVRYLFFQSGPLVSNVAEAGIFLRTRPELRVPDLQLLFGPAYYVNHGLTRLRKHAFGFGPTLITPESCGEIVLRSSNPLDPPAIRANYLSAVADLQTLVEGVRLARRIVATKPFDPYRGEELTPGNKVESGEQIAEFIRAESQTLYHPVGTCKMGTDAMAVVDARLRVRGIEDLRVVDASVMPKIIAGNTNAPTIMIAEKAAEMIRADRALGT